MCQHAQDEAPRQLLIRAASTKTSGRSAGSGKAAVPRAEERIKFDVTAPNAGAAEYLEVPKTATWPSRMEGRRRAWPFADGYRR